MATLQVKGMDDALYRALAARAAQDNRSISQQVVAMIRDLLASPRCSARDATEAFLELCGGWADERPAEEIAQGIRAGRLSGGRSVESFDVLD